MGIQEKSLSASMNARIIGSGNEPFVLAHGYGGDQSLWDKIVPSLAQHYRVVVFDWACSGAVKDPDLFDPDKYSTFHGFADDLIAIMDEMNLKSAVFMGHSMSGMIGCIASIKRPDLFNRLILLAANPRYINSDDYEGGFDESAIENIISSIESDFYKWATAFPSVIVGSHDPIFVKKFETCLKSMRPEVALTVAKAIFYSDYREILEKVLTQCTIIQTTSDLAVPNSVGYFMQKHIKGKSTVEIIDIDGHIPQLTAPKQLLDVLTGALGGFSSDK